MTYIDSKGNVQQGEKPLGHFAERNPKLVILGGILLASILKNFWQPHPLANGSIPASDTPPHGHWNRLANDNTLLRRLSEPLIQQDAALEMDLKVASGEMMRVFDLIDDGGLDGHRFEKDTMDGMESFCGTRCGSTRSALTAYFCGAEVARNQNVALKQDRKIPNMGVDSFRRYLECRHAQGQTTKRWKRTVYRLGIGNDDSQSAYGHAWSIIGQPDGSYLWLQSYIQQYSLHTWMAQVKPDGSPRGELSFYQLMKNLDAIERLQKIDTWTSQANKDYSDLFFVDKDLEAAKNAEAAVSEGWKSTHRLDYFFWDEACQYPLPEESSSPSVDAKEDEYDECFVSMQRLNLLNMRAKWEDDD